MLDFEAFSGGRGWVKSQKADLAAYPPPPHLEIFFPMADENHGQEPDRDLFGNPLEPLRDRRGRPSFGKTKENQDFVAVRAAMHWSHARIAEALGCDEKTLRKYFSRELREGAMIIEGMCLDVTLRRVREGHMPSVRMMQERLERVAAPPPPSKPAAGEEDAPEDVRPLGKKQQQLAAASQPVAGYGDLYERLAQSRAKTAAKNAGQADDEAGDKGRKH